MFEDKTFYWLITQEAATLDSAKHWQKDNVEAESPTDCRIDSDACALCRLKAVGNCGAECALGIIFDRCYYPYTTWAECRTESLNWAVMGGNDYELRFKQAASRMRDELYEVAYLLRQEINKRNKEV